MGGVLQAHLVPSLCLLATLGLYFGAKRLYRRWPRWWSSPMILVPAVLIAGLLLTRIPYVTYTHYSHWLTWLLGPATVGFALPIYEYRAVIRRHGLALSVGVTVGLAVALLTSVGLARLLGLSDVLARSLSMRSVSTPFAMLGAPLAGGAADIAAICVVITGVFGAIAGEWLLGWLPVKSPLAKGAMFGVAAHGVGTAKAYSRDAEEGMIASLTMVIAGVIMVLIAPWLRDLL